MNLGTQTGSLMNHLYSRAVIGQPKPEVGMGATILMWTDRYPATIIRVFTIGKAVAVEVQKDDYERIDSNGFSESQAYKFSPNPNGSRQVFRQAANGTWKPVRFNPETKRWAASGGAGLRIGKRNRYYDFSF